MVTAATGTSWALKGQGYEFCNCDFGCGCNFGGFPNSKDGSCRAFVGMAIDSGSCGSVDLSGVKCAAIVAWPKAIHEGHGQCVFVVEPTATDKQIEALGQIFTGKLGGMPWELLGPTLEVNGLVKARISIEGSGPKSVFRAEGIGEGRGDTFKNPVTGEDSSLTFTDDDPMFNQRRMAEGMAVRTRYFDDFFTAATDAGLR